MSADKQVWVVRDRNTEKVFSIWASAKGALDALDRYRDYKIIGSTGEVAAMPFNQDGFQKRDK